jgi:dTDP-4-amino-4,6-dideoxygalactose transaminase
MHQLPHLTQYRVVGREGDACPQSERLSAQGLSLPSGCALDDATVKYVAETVKQLTTMLP